MNRGKYTSSGTLQIGANTHLPASAEVSAVCKHIARATNHSEGSTSDTNPPPPSPSLPTPAPNESSLRPPAVSSAAQGVGELLLGARVCHKSPCVCARECCVVCERGREGEREREREGVREGGRERERDREIEIDRDR